NANTRRSPSWGRAVLGSSARAKAPSGTDKHSPSPMAAVKNARRPWARSRELRARPPGGSPHEVGRASLTVPLLWFYGYGHISSDSATTRRHPHGGVVETAVDTNA